jgi:hypothetical protein
MCRRDGVLGRGNGIWIYPKLSASTPTINLQLRCIRYALTCTSNNNDQSFQRHVKPLHIHISNCPTCRGDKYAMRWAEAEAS